MRTAVFIAMTLLVPSWLFGADDSPTAKLQHAVTALADEPHYGWTTTSTVTKSSVAYMFPAPGSAVGNTNDPLCCDDGSNVFHVNVVGYFIAGSSNASSNTSGLNSWTTEWPSGLTYPVSRVEGEAQQGGVAVFKLGAEREADKLQIVAKNGKTAVKVKDVWLSQWQLDYSATVNRGFAWVSRQMKTPVAEATALVAGATNITAAGSGYSVELSPECAEALLTGPPGGDNRLTAASGNATFHVIDGKLDGYELHLQGTGTPANGLHLDWTFEVKVTPTGAENIDIPTDALAKLQD